MPLKHSKPQHTAIFVHQSELASKMFPTLYGWRTETEIIKHFVIRLQQLATQLQESTYPVLLRSIIDGKNDRRYVHVQISSNMTDSKLWKLNRALCNGKIWPGNQWKSQKINWINSILTIFPWVNLIYTRYAEWRVNNATTMLICQSWR